MSTQQWKGVVCTTIVSMILIVGTSMASVTNDRVYLLGDHNGPLGTIGSVNEGSVAGNPVGFDTSDGFEVTFDSEVDGNVSNGLFDFQRLEAHDHANDGSPHYVDITRPNAIGTLGVTFDGINDRLEGRAFNRPDWYWDQPPFFNIDSQTQYPRNYEGITSRGLQTWVKPNSNQQNVRQDVVLDSSEFGGVVITANNKWGMAYDMDDTNRVLGNDGVFEAVGAQAGVAFDQWTHLEVRTLTGVTNAVMYVNGEAVAIGRGAGLVFGYETASKVDPSESNSVLKDSPEPLFVGASDLNGDGSYENHFQGQVDELTMYLWGDNSGQPGGPLGQEGKDWGTYDFFTDNAYVAGLNLLMGDFDQNGVLDSADTAVIVNNWRGANLMEGFPVGDLNTYRTMGDMNVDGVTDWNDWAAYRDAYIAENGVAPSFADVPEPATMLLLGAGGLVLARRRKRGGSTKSQWRGKRMTQRFSSVAIIAIVMLFGFGAANVSAQTLWNIDFQGDIEDSAGDPVTFYGQDGIQYDHGPDGFGQWNHFTVEAVEANPNPDNYSIDPSLNLVNSSGVSTGITFAFTGKVGGWNGPNVINDSLISDFIILLPEGNLGTWPALPLLATVSGLTPNATYTMGYISGDNGGRDSLIRVDTNFDGILDDTNDASFVAAGGGARTPFTFQADATGKVVMDYNLNSAGEANLAGFQLVEGTLLPDDILKAVVNRETGNVTLVNNLLGSAPDVELVGYSLLSTVGGLKSGSWTSITDNYDQAPQDGSVDSDDDWMIVAQNNSELGEGTLGLAEVASGQTIDLGNAWLQSIFEDVAFEYLTADGTLVQGIVEYTGDAIGIGDLTGAQGIPDGVVDVLDWVVFRANFDEDITGLSTVEAYLLGDLDINGVVDVVDYGLFKAAYEASSPPSAPSFEEMIANVPEPSMMTLIGVGGLAMMRRRKDTRCRRINMISNTRLTKLFTLVLLVFGLMTAQTASAQNTIINFNIGTNVGAGGGVDQTAYNTVDFNGNSQDDIWNNFGSAAGGVEYGNVQDIDGFSLQGVTIRVDGVAGLNPADGIVDGSWNNALDVPDNAVGSLYYQNPTGFMITVGGLAPGSSWQVEVFAALPKAGTFQDITINGLFADGTAGPSSPGDGDEYARDLYFNSGTPADARVMFPAAVVDGSGKLVINTVAGQGNPNAWMVMEAVRLVGAPMVPDLLTLQVNTATGEGKLLNNSGFEKEIDYYQITSESGLLDSAGWNSLEDQDQAEYPAGDGSGNGWEELGTPKATKLAEAYLQSTSIFADEAMIGLGALSNVTGSELEPQGDGDLVFNYRLPDGTLIEGLVEYYYDATQIILGDVNGDGLVNGFDVDPFVDVLLNGPYQAEADVNEDGAVNGFDVDPFVALVLGGGSGSGPAGTEVPEPATLALLGLGGLVAMRRRR